MLLDYIFCLKKKPKNFARTSLCLRPSSIATIHIVYLPLEERVRLQGHLVSRHDGSMGFGSTTKNSSTTCTQTFHFPGSHSNATYTNRSNITIISSFLTLHPSFSSMYSKSRYLIQSYTRISIFRYCLFKAMGIKMWKDPFPKNGKLNDLLIYFRLI